MTEGNPNSLVRVVAFEDLQCRDCTGWMRMLDEHLLPRFGDQIAVEHRDFPLAKHSWARPAAVAARFFAEAKPETGLAFRRFLLNNIASITPETLAEQVGRFATTCGLKAAAAEASLVDDRLAALVEEDYQLGLARGVRRTPTVFVGEECFVERFPLEAIAESIAEAVRRNQP